MATCPCSAYLLNASTDLLLGTLIIFFDPSLNVTGTILLFRTPYFLPVGIFRGEYVLFKKILFKAFIKDYTSLKLKYSCQSIENKSATI